MNRYASYNADIRYVSDSHERFVYITQRLKRSHVKRSVVFVIDTNPTGQKTLRVADGYYGHEHHIRRRFAAEILTPAVQRHIAYTAKLFCEREVTAINRRHDQCVHFMKHASNEYWDDVFLPDGLFNSIDENRPGFHFYQRARQDTRFISDVLNAVKLPFWPLFADRPTPLPRLLNNETVPLTNRAWCSWAVSVLPRHPNVRQVVCFVPKATYRVRGRR